MLVCVISTALTIQKPGQGVNVVQQEYKTNPLE